MGVWVWSLVSFAMDRRGLRIVDLGFNTESATSGASGGKACERAWGVVVEFPPCYPWRLSTRWLTHWVLNEMGFLSFWPFRFLFASLCRDFGMVLSTCLVQLLDPKSCVLQKVGPKIAFGNYKKLRLGQKLHFKNVQRTRIWLWTSSGPFYKSPWAFWGIRWEWVCKYQIALQLMSSKIAQYIPLWVIFLLYASSFTILQPKQKKHRTNSACQRTQQSSKRKIKEEEGHHPTTNPTPPLQSFFNSW